MKRQKAMPTDAKPTLTPKLRFPEFKKGSWEEKKIGDFLEESRIKGSSGDVANKLTVKLWGKGVFEKIETLSGSVNTQYYRREAGQFIYSKLDFLNQAFGVIPAELDGFESTVDLPCFDISKELHTHFLLEYVKRPAFYEKFGELADGGRKAKRIQAESFLSFPIRVPGEFHEQQKIAECLSTLDELTGAESQKLDALKAHKKGLMRKLFPREGETLPRLRFPEFRSAPEWEEMKLGSVGEVLMCKRIFASETNGRSGVPFYKIGTLGGTPDAYISKELFEDYRARYNLPRIGEVLITCSGTVGKCLPYDGRDAYYQDSNIVWIDNPTGTVSNEFLFRLLSRVGWATLNSTTITRIYGPDLKGLVVRFPKDSAEQHRIASCLSSLDDLITAQSDKLSTLNTHKQGLMQQLFPSPVEIEG